MLIARDLLARFFDAALLALVLSVLLTRVVLALVRKWQLGQQVREDGPASHQVKQGTPSLGGIAILAATAIAMDVVRGGLGGYAARLLGLAALFALLGLADDLSKLLAGNTRGIPARYRIVLEILFAVGFVELYPWSGPVHLGFTGLVASGSRSPLLAALGVFTIVGSANAVNFTDGVDGLAATVTVVCAVVMALACAFCGQVWLSFPLVALAGAAGGFLYFNSNPAKIFMGDVGSLGIGALLGAIAVASGLELFFALAGVVFVVEVVSVILQVAYFRRTGGKRLFRMTPIHHAFELRGWSEPQIVARFALVGLVAGGAALAAFLCRL
jgi:phospho-N-acetylmuramoyl-pentapeptide-transferase